MDFELSLLFYRYTINMCIKHVLSVSTEFPSIAHETSLLIYYQHRKLKEVPYMSNEEKTFRRKSGELSLIPQGSSSSSQERKT